MSHFPLKPSPHCQTLLMRGKDHQSPSWTDTKSFFIYISSLSLLCSPYWVMSLLLYNIIKICPFLSGSSMKVLIHALVITHFFCCSLLLSHFILLTFLYCLAVNTILLFFLITYCPSVNARAAILSYRISALHVYIASSSQGFISFNQLYLCLLKWMYFTSITSALKVHLFCEVFYSTS